MPHPTGPTDENLRKIIVQLRKSKEKDLVDVARHLEKSRRRKIPVNVGRLEKMGKKQQILVVPGKVLGSGELRKPVSVYAWTYSKEARQKIERAGGQALHLTDLLKDKPKARIVV